MELQSSTEKLDKYYKRLAKGKTQKIKPAHVEKVMGKLQKKEVALRAEIDDATKGDKKKRLKRKLKLTQEQIQRAKWLLEKVAKEQD